jgi:O-antigen ligase
MNTLIEEKRDWRQKALRASVLCTLLAGVVLPVSTAAVNGLLGLALLLLVGAGRWQAQWMLLARQPAVLGALGIFFLFALGLLYTSAPPTEALRILAKYRELFYLPLLILIFRDPLASAWGLRVFLATMLIVLGLSYLGAWELIALPKGSADNPVVVKNHITQSILLAFTAYLFALAAWQRPARRWPYLAVALAAAYNVALMTQSRSGYLVLACLWLLLAWQIGRLRGLLLGLLLAASLGAGAYLASEDLRWRLDQTWASLSTYQAGEIGQSAEPSAAMRLEFLRNSLQLARAAPWLGTGTGSFAHEYRKLAAGTALVATVNPHSEYLLWWVQLGLPGLFALPFLFWLIWRSAGRLPLERRYQTQGLLVAMAAGCLFNSLLLDFTEAHVFVYCAAFFLAKTLENPDAAPVGHPDRA